MMIQYDKTELVNISLVEEAHSLKNASFINKEQYKLVLKELTTLKSNNNILIRIGFFILGSFLYSSICGFISLISLDALAENYTVLIYLFAIIGFIGTEVLTKQKYYGHGLDDAFLIGSQLTLAIAIGISTNGNGLAIASIIALTSLLSYLRYTHLSMALLFCFALASSLIYGLFEMGNIGKTILPFALMLFSITIYFCSKMGLKKQTKPFYYKGILLANTFSLVLFYLSGNYLVVRELSVVLLGAGIPPKSDIPFAFFFYAFTFIIPVGYVVYSLFKKDRNMLWIGLVALGFSIYTIRYYYAILPIETVLTIGGLILFAFTFFSIKKLKEKETGITFQPDRLTKTNAFMNAELLIASQLGLKPETTVESPMEFGGGGFSGGGSTDSF